jgi:uncharacterized protein (TIGR02391 family)
MRASELLRSIDEFRDRLVEHRDLYLQSLDSDIPSFPIRNTNELEAQSAWLTRRLGALRDYLLRFQKDWVMFHAATGTAWNILDSAVGLNDVSQAKAPALRSAIEKLNTVAGKIESLDADTDIPANRSQPISVSNQAVPSFATDSEELRRLYVAQLHPYIAAGCSKLYLNGHYTQAVGEASRAVFEYLRTGSGLALDGVPLAQQAFSVQSPKLKFSDLSDETKRNEQVGFMEMLVGFAKGVRNPLAHTHGRQEEAQKAFEYLVMASLFCRRIDDAKP